MKQTTKIKELKTQLNDFYLMCVDMCNDVYMIREALYERIFEIRTIENLDATQTNSLINYSNKLIK
jgi:hypothetical protein